MSSLSLPTSRGKHSFQSFYISAISGQLSFNGHSVKMRSSNTLGFLTSDYGLELIDRAIVEVKERVPVWDEKHT